MSNELLIEVGAHETRVAVVADGRLVEVHIERAAEPGVVGNLYKGRVSRVVPGIQAAFVDIGLARHAFLFAGDLRRAEPIDLSTDDGQQRQRPEPRPITEHVKEGQELLVQAVKEPLPGKGARISLQISLPGRLLVLLPGANGVGISRRISLPDERQRLEELVEPMLPADNGLIVRTAGAEKGEKDLHRDLEWLSRAWQETKQRWTGISAPSLVRREMSLAMRAARDLLNDTFSEVWVDGVAAHAEIGRYLAEVDREMVARVRLHAGDETLFETRGVEESIVRAMRTRVWLDSGGFIVINPTEALVAIDVNSGRHTEAAALEATALQTNLEAAVEVARQIRLRDLAGIIVVDFIDMIDPEHRAELLACFQSALSEDSTRTQVSEMSDFGLIAVTRKRMRGGLLQRLTEVCPCCSGEGRIKDATTVGLELERALRRRAGDQSTQAVRVRLHPRIKKALESDPNGLLTAIRERVGGALELEADDAVGFAEFEIKSL